MLYDYIPVTALKPSWPTPACCTRGDRDGWVPIMMLNAGSILRGMVYHRPWPGALSSMLSLPVFDPTKAGIGRGRTLPIRSFLHIWLRVSFI
ncbi:hypothetical protein CC2G_008042 [Coprinopsis cinerea AmutBmut pab1-1]|nr:hypothetical protein CC2G_008042 [Coprinopsis cinerea AmutBmut pab1-1]